MTSIDMNTITVRADVLIQEAKARTKARHRETITHLEVLRPALLAALEGARSASGLAERTADVSIVDSDPEPHVLVKLDNEADYDRLYRVGYVLRQHGFKLKRQFDVPEFKLKTYVHTLEGATIRVTATLRPRTEEE